MASYSSSTAFPPSLPLFSPSLSKKKGFLFHSKRSRRPKAPITSLMIGVEEIAQLAHNKVLVASTVASAIGQLSKPVTSAIRGRGFDLKAAIGSGGMPSTHSAGVMAAATSLGLERGFSDSIFGMSVVFAAFVMYDAQGVRREVGNHAKVLNRMPMTQEKANAYLEEDALIKSGSSLINSEEVASLPISLKANSFASNSESYSCRSSKIKSNDLTPGPSPKVDVKEVPEKIYINYSMLNESVGHTEIQVIVGALLGFVVSLTLDTIL